MSETKKNLSEMTSEDRIAVRDKAVEVINNARAALGANALTPQQITRVVGGGGFTPSSEYILTGEVKVVKIEGTTNAFLAATTTTGENISLKALISQNPAGYATSGNFYNESSPNSEDAEVLTPTFDTSEIEVKASHNSDPKTGNDADPKAIYNLSKKLLNHGTKSEIELFGLITEGLWTCKGLKLTYCGKVYKQTTARKQYEFGAETIEVGARRAMSISVWWVHK